MIKMKHFILSAMMVMAGMMTQAQDVVKELKDDVNRSAGTYYSLPAVKVENDTPAPGGRNLSTSTIMPVRRRIISKRRSTMTSLSKCL